MLARSTICRHRLCRICTEPGSTTIIPPVTDHEAGELDVAMAAPGRRRGLRRRRGRACRSQAAARTRGRPGRRPDRGVDVDGAVGLELDDLRVRDATPLPERLDRQAGPRGERAGEGDGEAAPQLGCVPLPQQVRGVVVAVDAQRLAQPRVGFAVAVQAPRRPAVRSGWLVASGSAGLRAAAAVSGSERWAVRVTKTAGCVATDWDALAAGEAADEEVPRVALCGCATVPGGSRTARTHAGPVLGWGQRTDWVNRHHGGVNRVSRHAKRPS